MACCVQSFPRCPLRLDQLLTTTNNHKENNMQMNFLTQQIIWGIQQSEAVYAYEAILEAMSDAEEAARLAWVEEEQSAEWEQATALVEQLNDDAQAACNQLVKDLRASGVQADSNCGHAGDFSVWLLVAGVELAGWDTDYVIAGPR